MAQPFHEFLDDKRLLNIAFEWEAGADDLAVWAMERLVNRRDVWGQYTLKDGQTGVVTLPVRERRGTGSDMVTLNKLRRSFSGRAISHLIGLHAVSDHQTCKWFALDVDLHDETAVNSDETALANLAACRAWAKILREQLMDPCLIDSNGVGGYHLWVLLDREYPLRDVYDFVANLREDYPKYGLVRVPEIFPSRPALTGDQLGSWLRIPGRHHTRRHYSRVWNFDTFSDQQWLEGSEAVESLLEIRPSQLPKRKPAAAKQFITVKIDRPDEVRSLTVSKPRVCVDLDGVLARYDKWQGTDRIGSPVPGALEFMRELARVAEIIIFTSRCAVENTGQEPQARPGKLRIKIIDWLEKYNFPYSDVYIGQGKPRNAAAFIDDRAVRCRPQYDPNAFRDALVNIYQLINRKIPESIGDRKDMKEISEEEIKSTLKISDHKLVNAVDKIRSFYQIENGVEYSADAIVIAIATWLELRIESLTEGFDDYLTTPHLSESQDFRKILDTVGQSPVMPETESVLEHMELVMNENIFNGFRRFSIDRLTAMITYLARKGNNIYKTKLNKLLFYADFVNFYINGKSISGANYLRFQFGPVPDQYEAVLKRMRRENKLAFKPKSMASGVVEEIRLGTQALDETKILSPDELAALDWVLAEYGGLTVTEIVEVSHQEKAYTNTRPNEKIAYGFAQLFKKLPPQKP